MADAKAAASGQAAQTVTNEGSLLDQIVETASSGAAPDQRERGRDLVKEFVAQVLQGEMTVSRDTEAMINARDRHLPLKDLGHEFFDQIPTPLTLIGRCPGTRRLYDLIEQTPFVGDCLCRLSRRRRLCVRHNLFLLRAPEAEFAFQLIELVGVRDRIQEQFIELLVCLKIAPEI